ncbi:MAG: CopD family protein [Chloroflexota bacterium]
MDLEQVLAIALHTAAFVVVWGYYGTLARMILPGLAGALDLPAQARTLAAIERRALPLVALSVGLFVVSGTYLLVINPDYRGLGSFGTTWAVLMLLKHLLVIGLVGLGVIIDYLIRGLPDVVRDEDRAADMRWLRWAAEGATALGALIVLLTAAAQGAI